MLGFQKVIEEADIQETNLVFLVNSDAWEIWSDKTFCTYVICLKNTLNKVLKNKSQLITFCFSVSCEKSPDSQSS